MPSSISFQEGWSYLPSSAATLQFCPWRPQSYNIVSHSLRIYMYKMDLEQNSGFPGNEYTPTFPPHSAQKGHKMDYANYKPWWAGSSSSIEKRGLMNMERKGGSHLLKTCCMPGTILAVLGTLFYMPMKSSPSSFISQGPVAEHKHLFGNLE